MDMDISALRVLRCRMQNKDLDFEENVYLA